MHPLFHLIYKIYLPKKQQNYSTKRAFVYGQGCTVHRWHIVQSERQTAERCGLHPLFLIRCQRSSHWAMPFGICENLGKDAGKILLCIFFINKRLLSTNNAARYTTSTSCNRNDRRRNGAVYTLYFSYAAESCRTGQCHSEFMRIWGKMQGKCFSASFL